MSFGELYALAYSYTGNREDAEDVAQEAAVKLWRRADDDPSHITRIVHTTAIDHWRKTRHDDGSQAYTPMRVAPSAEREALARLFLAEVCTDVPQLVALAAGYHVHEIASRYNEPEGTIKSHAHTWRQTHKDQAWL